MREYVTEAVVLHKEPRGEADAAVSFFSRRYGQMTARARSVRKITSKLSAHCEPGNVLLTRIVEKKGFHVVDALKKSRLSISPPDLFSLHKILEPAQADSEIWACLTSEQFNWRSMLRVLGWDAKNAKCFECKIHSPGFFHIARLEFVCASCCQYALGEVLSVNN